MNPNRHIKPPTHRQDFISGPASAPTLGYFSVDQVTGPGQAHATNAFSASPDQPADGHCVDAWTLLPAAVPVAGLTPYPADVRGQPDWAAQVVVTPVALLTLGDTAGGSVADKYDRAYASLGVAASGGAYGNGMVNSDPAVLLATKEAGKVAAAVASLAASAKVLGTLSAARALYECREGAGARLSNELFYQVGWVRAGVWWHVWGCWWVGGINCFVSRADRVLRAGLRRTRDSTRRPPPLESTHPRAVDPSPHQAGRVRLGVRPDRRPEGPLPHDLRRRRGRRAGRHPQEPGRRGGERRGLWALG